MPRFTRAFGLALVPLLAACAVRLPATPIAPGALPAAPSPTLSGTVGSRPFVAQSAIMLHPTRWNDGSRTQVLRIYERPMTCASADDAEWGDGAVAGERFLEVTIGGEWPMFPGSEWRAQIGAMGSRDGSGVDFSFTTIRGGGGGSGAHMSGTMRVLSATRGAGVVAIEAARTTSDPFLQRVAPKDIDPNDLGSLSGNVAFLVCEGGRGG